MQTEKRENQNKKSELHPRNKHRERYDFDQLTISCPELAPFVKLNDYNDLSVDFFNPEAVKMLNKALLKHFYNIERWDLPKNYLCPPIPGRADYIHHIADLLGSSNNKKIPTGNKIKCLDIGVGANCVYPIIGHQEYSWSFVGSDVDPVAIESATQIVENNPSLKGQIELRLQTNTKGIFRGIVHPDERFDLTVCNPPFHGSSAEALAVSVQKNSNLKGKRINKPTLNFGGRQNELWCEGGEVRFIHDMIIQSQQFATSCFYFSTLVSKESNLKEIYKLLQKLDVVELKTITMEQGNKTSRVVAWTFLSPKLQKLWISARWNS